jgi:hypothetical protein
MGYTIPIQQADRRYPVAATNPLAASAVVAATPGWLRGIYGYNSGPSQFIQIHDAAALPADTTVPLFSLPVAAGQPFSFVFSEELRVTNGIQLCNSSTAATKTIGAADVQFLCTYRLRA